VSDLTFPLSVEIIRHHVYKVQIFGYFDDVVSKHKRRNIVREKRRRCRSSQIRLVKPSPFVEFSKTRVGYTATIVNAYPAAIASKLAGTAAVSNSRGRPELLDSPSKANRNSFSRFTYAALSSDPLGYSQSTSRPLNLCSRRNSMAS